MLVSASFGTLCAPRRPRHSPHTGGQIHKRRVPFCAASTRKLYEKKLQKLLDDGPALATIANLVVTEIQVNHNGNSESDLYSDKEDGKAPCGTP